MKNLKRKLTAAILSVLLATSSFTAAPISVTAATSEETEIQETAAPEKDQEEKIGDLQYGDFEYTILKDGSLEISKYYGIDSIVTIPSTINGKIVTSIGENAFLNCYRIKCLNIPNTVKNINPDSFYQCDRLEKFCVEENNQYYTSDNCGCLISKDRKRFVCYPVGRKSTFYSVPQGIISIGRNAFLGSRKLAMISLPDSLRIIDSEVFYYCDNLWSINIPNNVTDIGAYAFAYCEKLESISIPNNVTEIKEATFTNCKNLKSITIPASVKIIEEWAFYNCENLSSISLSEYTTTIEDRFEMCTSLNDVYYYGSKSQWDNINFTYSDSRIRFANIHYNFSNNVTGKLYREQKQIEDIDVNFEGEWFADNSYYNHNISMLCSEMVCMGYNAESHIYDLVTALENLGFSMVDANTDTGRDQQNYFIASRPIEKNGRIYNLVFMGLIGSHGEQWNSDFDPWGINSSTNYDDTESLKDINHRGFNDAKNFGYEKLSKCLTDNNFTKENTVLLLTGHSRGAAAANLLAAKLIDDNDMISLENMFTYTFATPNCTCDNNRNNTKYNTIYNIVFPNDFVTKMMPASWDFGRYGKTYSLPTKTNDANYYSFVNISNTILSSIIAGEMVVAEHKKTNYERKMLDCLEDLTGSREFSDYPDGEESVWEIVDEMTSHVDNIHDFYYQNTNVLGNKGISLYIFFQNFLCPFVNGADEAQLKSATNLGISTMGTYYWNIMWFFKENQIDCPRVEDTHKSETYCAFMLAMNSDEVTTYRKGYNGSVNCPVDIEITEKESGEVVGRIVNNTVDEEIAAKPNSVVMTVDGDEKEFWLPGNGEYDVRLIGNDNGVMDYTIREIDPDTGETNRVNYYDVPVEKDKAYTDFFTSEKAFVITAENGSELTPDETFNSENEVTYSVTVTAEGSGTASDSLTVTSGDYVTLTASPVESEFLGWYQNDTLVSTDLEYRFRPTEDISLTAKFTGEDLKPVEFGDVDVDEEVTISDATQIQMYLAELVELEDVQVLLSDYNLDGSVDISDATQIQLKLAELI